MNFFGHFLGRLRGFRAEDEIERSRYSTTRREKQEEYETRPLNIIYCWSRDYLVGGIADQCLSTEACFGGGLWKGMFYSILALS